MLRGPLAQVMAARQSTFADYARQVVDNAAALAEGLARRGARLVTGGTDNHLGQVDVRSFGVTGRQAEAALEESGVIVNRNSIPFDPNGAWYTSGIRLGTPALTTLGMDATDMDEVADIVALVLRSAEPTTTSTGKPSKAKFNLDLRTGQDARSRASDLLTAHPLYPQIGSL